MQTRASLTNALKYLGGLGAAAILFVLFDFMIDLRPSGVHESYRFRMPDLVIDQPVILRQDNLAILLIERSPETILALEQARTGLQDADSSRSRQPDWAHNPWRSRESRLFVAFALGTHFGCPLEIDDGEIGETCSDARYDFAGRALTGTETFQNLSVPDYTLSADAATLIIKP